MKRILTDKKLQTRIVIFLMLFGVVVTLASALICKQLLLNSHNIISCNVTKTYIVGRDQRIDISYKYNYNGLIFENSISINQQVILAKNSKCLIGKSFPLAVYTKCHKINYPLIFPIDFKVYGISFPDSLQWILPLLEK